MHRNVILRDGPEIARQILPYTTTPPVGSPNPRDLYAWLQNFEDTTGGEAFAIAHNGNLSNGWVFSLVDDFAEGTPPFGPRICRSTGKMGTALRMVADQG